MTVVRRTTGRKTSRPRTNGRKSDERKLAAQHQRSPRRNSPMSFVAMAMATWSCSGASSHCYSTASSRRCSTASLQRYNAAARVATVLRRCCNTCRGSVAALLQLASRQHCCSSRRCGTVAASAALARVATTLRRCCGSQQRRKAAHYATMASGSSARGNGRQGYAALQRWQVANAEIFVLFCFFYSTVSKREREQDREKRDRASKPVSRLCWLVAV